MPPSHHLNLQKIAVFSILALILTAGIAFAVKKLINNEISPSEIISKSKIPTLAPGSNVTIVPTVPPTSDIVNWKTYADGNLKYSFQYPPTSCELQRSVGDTAFALCYLPKGSDGGSKHNNGYVINLGFISKDQLGLMGVSYCDANFNDSSRCELLDMGGISISIDWGVDSSANANVWISHPNGGKVTFSLQPVTTESKEMLNQILSTFKFTNQASQNKTKFTCPQNGWVDCMPIMDEAKILACSSEAETWYKVNCPNFQGLAQ